MDDTYKLEPMLPMRLHKRKQTSFESGSLHTCHYEEAGTLETGGLDSGGLESGGLESRATDFGSGSPLFCPRGLESGGLESRSTDFGSG